jgi:L-serine/L-threonine ammonia-lyase
VSVEEASSEVSCKAAKTLGGMKVIEILICCTHTSNSCLVKVPVVALETTGSNCFYNAIAINTRNFTSKVPVVPSAEVEDSSPYTIEIVEEHNIAIPHMKALKSRAASLGASSPAPGVVRIALDRAGGIKCACVPDEMAMHTARLFGGESLCDIIR